MFHQLPKSKPHTAAQEARTRECDALLAEAGISRTGMAQLYDIVEHRNVRTEHDTLVAAGVARVKPDSLGCYLELTPKGKALLAALRGEGS